MLEGIIEKVLLDYFGELFENFDKKQLSVALWRGEVLLENLTFNKNCLEKFVIPIKLKYGKIKKISVKIDWKSNFTKPTIIEIDGVDLVLGILNQSEWKEDHSITYQSKLTQLKNVCNKNIELLAESNKGNQSGSYLASLALKIIDNIQLSLKNLHIRIEDTNTKMPYSMGFTMNELKVVSTAEDWKQMFIERTPDQKHFFKLLTLQSFGFYLNANESQFTVEVFDPSKVKLNYLINPMSLEAKLIQNNKAKDNEPSYKGDISLDHLGFDIRKDQYRCIMSILSNISLYRKFLFTVANTRKYYYFKPKRPLYIKDKTLKIDNKAKKENAREWMLFAFKMVRLQFQQRRGYIKAFDIKTFTLNKYQKKFNDVFMNIMKTGVESTDEEFIFIVQCVSIDTLLLWVSSLIEPLYKEKLSKDGEKKKESLMSWFSSETIRKELSNDEQALLENMIKDMKSSKIITTEDRFIFQIDVLLHEGWLTVKTKEEGGDSFKIKFSQMNYSQKNYTSRSISSGSLKTIDITYYQQSMQKEYPITTTSLSKSMMINHESIISFSFINYAQVTTYDTELFLNVLSQDMLYNHSFLEQVKDFFKIDIEQNLYEDAYSNMTALIDSSQKKLKDNLSIKQMINIQILERCLYVPIQKDDITKANFLVFNLGKLCLSSSTEENVDDQYQVKYIFDFSSLSLKYYLNYDKVIKGEDGSNIFDNVSGSVKVEQKILSAKEKEKDVIIPIKITLDLGVVNITLNEYYYSLLISINDIFSFGSPNKNKLIVQCDENQEKNKQSRRLIYIKSSGIQDTWIPYWRIISSNYLYLYKDEGSLQYHSSFLLKGSDISYSNTPKFAMKLCNKFDQIDIQFASQKELDLFNDQFTSINLFTNNSQMFIPKENTSTEVFLELIIKLQKIECSLYESKRQDLMINVQIENNTISLNISDKIIDILIAVHHVRIINNKSTHTSFAHIIETNSEKEKEAKDFFIVKVKVDKSENSIGIDLKIGYLNIIYHPKTINAIINFFQTKPYYITQSQLANTKTLPDLQTLTCLTVVQDIKVIGEMKQLNIIFIQPNIDIFFMEINIEHGLLEFFMKFDHLAVKASVGCAEVYNLTNYPLTIKTQNEYNSAYRQIIFGSKANSKSSIECNVQTFQTKCPLLKDNINGYLDLNFNGVFLNFTQEEFMRVLNYIINEIVPSFTSKTQEEQQKVITEEDKEYQNMMKMHIRLTNPQVFLRARPLSSVYFVLDCKEVIVSNGLQKTKGKIMNSPEEERIVQLFQLELNNAIISSHDSFNLTNPINGALNIIVLKMKPKDFLLNSELIESSTGIDIYLSEINLRLRQKDFREIMRCFDLNLLYTDNMSPLFIFNEFSSDSEKSFNLQAFKMKEQKKKKLSIQINGLFEKLNLQVLHENIPFGEISLSNIYMKMFSFENSEFLLSLDVCEIKGKDFTLDKETNTTKSSPLFINSAKILTDQIQSFMANKKELIMNKQLIAKGESKYPYKQICFSFYKTPDKTKIMNLTLDSLIILLKLDTFLLFNAFLIDGLPDYTGESDDNCPNDFDPNQDNAPKMTFDLTTNKISICLLSDSLDNIDQDVIYLSSDFSFNYFKEVVSKAKEQAIQQNQDGLLSEIKINCNKMYIAINTLSNLIDLQKKERKIVNEFNMNLTLDSFFEKHENGSYVINQKNTINFPEIKLKLSYRDLVIILSIQSYETKLYDDYNKHKFVFMKKEITDVKLSNMNRFLRKLQQVQLAQAEQAKENGSELNIIGHKGIQILMINDEKETSYPFFILLFDKFYFKNKSKGNKESNMITSFSLRSYSYNYIASYWEPLVEGFPFYMTFLYDSTNLTQSKYCTSLKIEDMQIPYINISDLSIEFILQNLKNWIVKFNEIQKENQQLREKNIKKKNSSISDNKGILSNHKVVNHTGRKIILGSQNSNILETNKTIDLIYNEDKIGTDFGSSFTPKNKDCNKQTFGFTDIKLQPNQNSLDINALNCQRHEIITDRQNQFAYVLSKVELNGLKKYIYFYSPLVFKNKTKKVVTLGFNIKYRKDHCETLQPGESCGVPHEYYEGEVSIIFESNDIWKMSMQKLLLEPGVLEEKKTKNKLFYLLSYKKTKERTEGPRIIEIKHCYQIKNCLPVNIKVNVPDSNKRYSIAKNQTELIDCVSHSSILKVKLEIEALTPENDVKLYDPQNKQKISYLQLNTYDDNPLEICSMIYNEDERLIVLYSERVLVNFAGDDSRLYCGNNKNKLELIPNQFDNRNMFFLSHNTHNMLLVEYKGTLCTLINLKELPSILEVNCTNELDKTKDKKLYEFILESKISLLDIEMSLYSTILTLSPKYYILNQTTNHIELNFEGTKTLLYKHIYSHFDFSGKETKSPVTLKPVDPNNEWKKCNPCTLITNNMQTLKFQSESGDSNLYLNVEKCKETISTIIYITEANLTNSQYVLINETSFFTPKVYQQNYASETINLESNSQVCFGLSNHKENNIICIDHSLLGYTAKIQIIEDNKYMFTDKYQTEVYPCSGIKNIELLDKSIIRILVESNGFQNIIIFKEDQFQKTTTEKEKNKLYEFKFQMNGLGINFIGDNRNIGFHNNIKNYIRNDLLYMQFKTIQFYYSNDHDAKSYLIQFCIHDMQLSNEVSVFNSYPIVLAPIKEDIEPDEKEKNKRSLPLVNILIDYKVNQYNKMNVRELNCSFQPFRLKADSDLLLSLYNFIENLSLGTRISITSIHPIYSSVEENLKRKIFISGPFVCLLENKDEVRETNLVIDSLRIPSFLVRLSFLNQSNDFFTTILKNNYFLSQICGAMGSIEEVPLILNGCDIDKFIGNWDDLSFAIFQHYKEHLVSQAYKIFGGIAILGNPNTCFSIYSAGVKDFYKEPQNGFKEGPLQGFVGIAKGSASLIQHSFEGTFNSTSQVTSEISRTLLLASNDDEYMKTREQNKIKEKPKNVFEGIGFGMKSLATGVFHGVTDIVRQPIKGAQEDSFKGFGIGILKGLGGIISKPVSGVFDLVAKTSEGIKNNVSNTAAETQLRPPRVFYGSNKIMKSYNQDHAQILTMIKLKYSEVEKENFGWVASIDIAIIIDKKKEKKEKKYKMILTSEAMMLYNETKNDLSKKVLTKPILYYSDIELIQLKQNYMNIKLIADNKKTILWFNTQATSISKLDQKLKKVIDHKLIN